MKKTVLIAVAAAVALFFGACHKDGKYNPKQKISKIYSEYYSTSAFRDNEETWRYDTVSSPKTLDEEWTWDGNKLAKITYIGYDIRNGVRVPANDDVTFTYDGNQLVEVNSVDGRMVLTYDGSKLEKAEIYYIGPVLLKGSETPSCTITFTYEGKKIVRMTGVSEEYYWVDGVKGNRMINLLMQSVMPDAEAVQRTMATACEMVRKAGTKGTMTTVVDLTWDGDNVSKVTESVNGIGVVSTIEYSYDNKKNPLQGFLGIIFDATEVNDGSVFCNKNNVVRMFERSSMFNKNEIGTYEVNYTYTYDGDWPTSRTRARSYGSEAEGYYGNSRNTMFFEYK